MPTATELALTEPLVENAIVAAMGDVFVAAQSLGMTTVALDRAIRSSPRLQAVFLTTRQAVVERGGYESASAQAVEQDVQRRLSLYRSDALDALHSLATMQLDENSAQNQVKLAAAVRLLGGAESGGTSDFDSTLRSLNEDYQRNAPRIKEIRERIVTFETPAERLSSE